MFAKKIPFYYIVLTNLTVIVLTWFILHKIFNGAGSSGSTSSATAATKESGVYCDMEFLRLSGYKYVKPLIFAERQCESESLQPLKQNIQQLIENEKIAGNITAASVFIRVYKHGQWISINPDEKYHPASLGKVPIFFTYLRMAESSPELLNTKVVFQKHDSSLPEQEFKGQPLIPGNTYTVKDLLEYMIKYSDNDASAILLAHMDKDLYNKVYTDVKLTSPGAEYNNYTITAKDYSQFLKELYNATYLTIPASEYATSILAQSTFKDGLMKGLPQNITVAHKFGEYGDGTMRQLHESGIVYVEGGRPYLITVMTKGADWTKMGTVIGNISKLVYDEISTSTAL